MQTVKASCRPARHQRRRDTSRHDAAAVQAVAHSPIAPSITASSSNEARSDRNSAQPLRCCRLGIVTLGGFDHASVKRRVERAAVALHHEHVIAVMAEMVAMLLVKQADAAIRRRQCRSSMPLTLASEGKTRDKPQDPASRFRPIASMRLHRRRNANMVRPRTVRWFAGAWSMVTLPLSLISFCGHALDLRDASNGELQGSRRSSRRSPLLCASSAKARGRDRCSPGARRDRRRSWSRDSTASAAAMRLLPDRLPDNCP